MKPYLQLQPTSDRDDASWTSRGRFVLCHLMCSFKRILLSFVKTFCVLVRPPSIRYIHCMQGWQGIANKTLRFDEICARRNTMYSQQLKDHEAVRHLSHLNFLFSGRGSRVYDQTMVRLTRRLYQRVIEDMVPLQL